MVAKLKTLDDWLSCMDSLSPSTRSRLDQILAGFRPKANEFADDPLGYCREYLGVKLWDKQREIIEKLMTPPYQVLVRAGHNVGKTFVAACLASWFYDSLRRTSQVAAQPGRFFAQRHPVTRQAPSPTTITHHHHPPPPPPTTTACAA
jgi:hypothetical protein